MEDYNRVKLKIIKYAVEFLVIISVGSYLHI